MDVHWSDLLMAYAAVLLGTLSPGPNILAVVATSMSDGRRAGSALALGVAAGSCLWAVLATAGLTAVMASYALLTTAIKIAGGLYLLWLAAKAFRAAASSLALELGPDAPSDAPRAPAPSARFLQGLAIQMTNPKAALTWIAVAALGLGPNASAASALALIVGAAAISAAMHLGYARAFSTARVADLYRRARRRIQTALGLLFAAAGLKLLASRL